MYYSLSFSENGILPYNSLIYRNYNDAHFVTNLHIVNLLNLIIMKIPFDDYETEREKKSVPLFMI